IAPAGSPDLSDPANWRSSSFAGGTPGESDSTTFSGDPNADDNGNGVSNLVEYAVGSEIHSSFTTLGEEAFLTLEFTRNLAADDVIVTVEFTSDLISWTPLTISNSTIFNEDGTVTISMRSDESLATVRQFFRVRVASR
ncbi:MAG: hypothetical protein ABF382_01505, partial [Akkermansiaceae bacterium]